MHVRSLTVFAFLAASAVAGSVSAENTVDEIVGRYLDARGGLERLRAIRSARLTGTMSLQGHHGSVEAPITIEFDVTGGKMRLEYEMQGSKAVQAFDGETAWAIPPFHSGNGGPVELTEENRRALADQADFLGVLVDHEAKGHRVELMGTPMIEGTEAYELQVTRAGGSVVTLFLDTEHCLPFRRVSAKATAGKETKTVATLGDYKVVGGVLFAHSTSMDHGHGSQVVTYETIELDVDIADDRFTMPERVAAAAAGSSDR